MTPMTTTPSAKDAITSAVAAAHIAVIRSAIDTAETDDDLVEVPVRTLIALMDALTTERRAEEEAGRG